MIKLHPETAQEIANLITSIACADIMYRDEGNTRKRLYWMAKEFKAVIKLTEEYGIPHNGYDQAIRCMEQDMYANASLTEAA